MNVGVACSCVILEGKQGHDSFLFASIPHDNPIGPAPIIIRSFIILDSTNLCNFAA